MPVSRASASLHIALFGQGRLLVDGAPWKLNMARRTLPLLACLLLHREEPLSRDFLAFTLWPDDDEDVARTNLRRYLYQLQRALPQADGAPWLLIDAENAQWNPGANAWLDVADFEYRCEKNRDLAGAVALYGGDLLENLYDDWLFPERERLRHRCLAALDTLVDEQRERRDYPRAIEYARHLLMLDPWREDMMRRFMSLHYEAGNGAGALVEYRRFAERLQAEMNVAPMPETTTLRDRIARNEPLHGETRARPKAPSLPATGTAFRFVGRDVERNTLRERWSRAARGFGGMVLLAGEAGSGKSRLAAEMAYEVEREGGRVLWGTTSYPERTPYQAPLEALRSAFGLVASADIEPVWLASLADVLPEVRALRPDLPLLDTVEPDRKQLRLFEALTVSFTALARPRPLLLVLEDLHWAGMSTIEAMRFAARRAARARILVVGTYRDEEVRRLHPVRVFRREFAREPGFVHVALHGLDREDVRQLLSFVPELSSEPENLAAHLHARSEGNPLFLGELVRDFIESRRYDINPTLESGIGAIVAARISRLSPSARSLAEIAAVAGHGFTIDVVRDVSGWSEGDVLDALDELIDRHLVREVGRGQRFDHVFAHHLIRSTIYEDIAPDVRMRRHRRIARVFEDVYPNQLDDIALELALHYERGGAPESAAERYCSAAERAFAVYANDEALEYVARALGLTREGPATIALLRLRERLHGRRGNRRAQLADLDALDGLAATSADDGLGSDILWRRALVYRALGEGDLEIASLAALRERADGLAQDDWAARARQGEGAYQLLAGRIDAASELAADSLQRHRQLDDVEGQVESLCLLADIATIAGSLSGAREFLERAQSLADAQDNRNLVGRATMAASKAALLQQDFTSSEKLARDALVLYRTIGDLEGQADALGRIAAVLGRRFRIEEAKQSYAEASAMYAAIGKRRGLAGVLVNSGLLSFRVGETAAALAAFDAAARHFEALHEVRGQVICANNRSAAFLFSGDAAGAKLAALDAMELVKATRDPAVTAVALGNLGAAERDLGDIVMGIAHINEALELRSAGERPVDVLDDLADLALAHLEAGDLAAARGASERLLSTTAAADDLHYWPWRWYWVAAQVYEACDLPADARRHLLTAHTILQERAERVVDANARKSFFAIPFNCELLAAHERSIWPPRVARFMKASP